MTYLLYRPLISVCVVAFTAFTSFSIQTSLVVVSAASSTKHNIIHNERSLIQEVPGRNNGIPSSINLQTNLLLNNERSIRGGATTKNENQISKDQSSSTSSSSSPSPSTTTQIKKINPHVAILYGMILTFNSGLINGVTLSGILSSIQQPSSAVTGAWTNSALAIAESTSNLYTNLGLRCIYAYMGGSFVAGFFNPYPINYTMKKYTVRPSFLIASLAMYLSYHFVSTSDDSGSSLWILFAVFANGIQNSITSSLTSNLMRTAHYSGITSDMGTFLGQSVRGNKANGLKLKLFYVLGPCFWYGGYFSLGLTKALGSKTLLISCFLYLLFGIFSI